MTYTDKELESLLAAWDKITSVRSEDRKATPLTPNDPATIARLASELMEARHLLKRISECKIVQHPTGIEIRDERVVLISRFLLMKIREETKA